MGDRWDDSVDRTDYSEAKDYSEPVDHSIGSDSSSDRADSDSDYAYNSNVSQDDLSRRENSIKNRSLDQGEKIPFNGNNSSSKAGFFGSMSKKAKFGMAGGLMTVVMGGGFFAGFGLISGPMQALQLMNFLKENFADKVEDLLGARGKRNMHSLTKLKGGTYAERVRSSRLGILGNMLADRQSNRLSQKGVTFEYGNFGQDHGIKIDPKKYDGTDIKMVDADGNPTKEGIDWVRRTTGLDPKDFSIDPDGSARISSKLRYGKTKKVVNSLAGVGRFNLLGRLQTRSSLKKIGKLSLLHPLEAINRKAKEKLLDELTDFAEKMAKKIVSGDSTPNGARRKAEDRKRKECPNCSEDEITKAGDEAEKNFKDLFSEDIKDGDGKKIKDKLGKRGATKFSINFNSKLVGAAKAATGVGMVLAFIDVACMINDISETLGMYQQVNIVNVAQGVAGALYGIGSQVMAGDDISLLQLGYAVRTYMGDKVPVYDEDGNDTGERQFSGYWQASPVKAELGEEFIQGDPSVPDSLYMVGKDPMEDGALGMISSLSKIIGNNVTCWVSDMMGQALEFLLGWLTGPLMRLTGIDAAMQSLMQTVLGFLGGDPLNIKSMIPKQYGAAGTYGAFYNMNEQMRQNGGRRLTQQEAYEVNREHDRMLAERWQEKPLLAKLFDPADYKSSLNQIARAVDIDTSSQSALTQFGNVAKLFASAPSLLLSGINKMNHEANAAAGYDYGVPEYGYSLDEIEKITDASNEEYEMVDNYTKMVGTDDNGGLFSDNGIKNKLKVAAGVDVTDTGEMSHVTNDDSEAEANATTGAWSYLDDTIKDGNSAESWTSSDEDLSLRVSLMDYNIINQSACIEGDPEDGDTKEACDYVGIDNGGGGSSAPGIDGFVPAIADKTIPITSPFGNRVDPMSGSVLEFHHGIDIGATCGTPVEAAKSGKVIHNGWEEGGGGNVIRIDHGNNEESGYAHLSKIDVDMNQEVEQGDVIGEVGTTGGRSTGCHLHFELKINGEYVDPGPIYKDFPNI